MLKVLNGTFFMGQNVSSLSHDPPENIVIIIIISYSYDDQLLLMLS